MNIKPKHSLFFILYSLFFIPVVSFAAFDGINKLLTGVKGLVKSAIPLAAGLAVLFFFYGIAQYILHAGDEKKAKEGKSIMIYGVIALFVLFSIFGLIKLLGDTIGLESGGGDILL